MLPYNRTNIKQNGFTLIELMITVAIVGILASISIPSYKNYVMKARFSEVIMATSPYKIGVSTCVMITAGLAGCDAGSNGVPPARTAAAGQVATVSITNGVITSTPVASNGIVATDTYILTPTQANGAVTWTNNDGAGVSGCIASALCTAL